MTRPDLEAYAERELGSSIDALRWIVRRLARRLRDDEQLVALCVGTRRLILHRPCVVALTDQRLILAWAWGRWDELEHATIAAVTDDTAAGELSLVWTGGVVTLKVSPPESAAEVVAAIAARVGAERVHARAGGDEARLALRAFAGMLTTGAVFVASYVLSVILQRS